MYLTKSELKNELAEKRNQRESLIDEVEGAQDMKELDKLDRQMDILNGEIRNLTDKLIDYTDKRSGDYNERTAAVNGEIDGIVIANARGQEQRNDKEVDRMDNNTVTEIRSLQKFLTTGINSMTEQEQRALNITGSAAVLPIAVQNELISSNKYSDLLHRAQVFNQGGAGSIYIPVASNTSASWKIENSNVDGLDVSYEKSPTLTKLELKGYELLRLMQLSAAASSMTAGGFESLMLELLASEVVETLESSFIKGTGTGQPKGLDNLTWTPDTNQILTATAETPISAKDLAEAISLLPQRYSRNAVILVNSDMMYQIGQWKGTAEYAYNMADGATKFLSKPIIVSEHMSDNTIYIVDPKELYIRFASPLALEMDRSAGFTSASIYLRALTVVDAVWNPAACVAVGQGS